MHGKVLYVPDWNARMKWHTFWTILEQAGIGLFFLVIVAAAVVAVGPDVKNVFRKDKK